MSKQIHVFCHGGPFDGHHLPNADEGPPVNHFTTYAVGFAERSDVGNSFDINQPGEESMYEHEYVCRSESPNEIHLTFRCVAVSEMFDSSA